MLPHPRGADYVTSQRNQIQTNNFSFYRQADQKTAGNRDVLFRGSEGKLGTVRLAAAAGKAPIFQQITLVVDNKVFSLCLHRYHQSPRCQVNGGAGIETGGETVVGATRLVGQQGGGYFFSPGHTIDDLGVAAGKALTPELPQFGLDLFDGQAGTRLKPKSLSVEQSCKVNGSAGGWWVVAGDMGASAGKHDQDHEGPDNGP